MSGTTSPARRWAPLLMAVLVFTAGSAAAACYPYSRVHVDGSLATSGDGASWATAFNDLQLALALARSCPDIEEIWVAAGTYRPTNGSDRTRFFELVDGVAMFGGFAGTENDVSERDWAASPTILSGDLGLPGSHWDDSHRVVLARGLGPDTLLDGFTIRDAFAPYEQVGPDAVGGSLLVDGGSPVLRRLRFASSWVGFRGGGLAVLRGATPVIEACSFDENHAEYGGGNLFVEDSEVIVVNSIFRAAEQEQYAALFCRRSRVTLVNSTFAHIQESAVYATLTSEVAIHNSILVPAAQATLPPIRFDSVSTVTVSHSLVSGSGGSEAWRPGFGIDHGGNLDADPRFVRATGALEDLRLSNCSPAADRGDPAPIQGFDLDFGGRPRVQGPGVDLGAWEGTEDTPFSRAGIGAGVGGSIVPGDYDTDGDIDLVIVGRESTTSARTAKYLRNEGDRFVQQYAGLPGQGYGARGSCADYDGDGDPDLVIAGTSGYGFPSLRTYRNDGGYFTAEGLYLTGMVTNSVDWADFDLDGDLDLLITANRYYYPGTPLTSLYRNKNGQFTLTDAGLPGVGSGDARWGDFDSDGDPDILLIGTDGNGARRCELYRNEGGTFVPVPAGIPGLENAIARWGDHDMDGDLDILVSGFDGATRRLDLYVQEGSGFTRTGAGLPAVEARALEWADYDGDGDLDLAFVGIDGSGAGTTAVYRNDHGTYVEADAELPRFSAGDVQWAHLDGDGLLDLVVTGVPWTEGGTSVFWGCSSDPVAPPEPPALLAESTAEDVVRLRWTPPPGAPPGGTWNLRVGTSSGFDDVVPGHADPGTGLRRVPAPGNRGHAFVAELHNLPTGRYTWTVQQVDAGLRGSAYAPERSFQIQRTTGFVQSDVGLPKSLSYPAEGRFGDYDADGDLDVVLTGFVDDEGEPFTAVLRNEQGFFAPVGAGIPPSARTAEPAWGDFDGDGDLDLAVMMADGYFVQPEVFRNDDGRFSALEAGLEKTRSDTKTRWLDYDGNGSLDLLIGSWSYGGVLAYLNRGDRFEEQRPPGLVGDTVAAEWGDYDGDGDLDVYFVGERGRSGVRDIFENVNGRFTRTETWMVGARWNASWGDYDGDGDLDLATSGSPAIIFRNDDGRFDRIESGLPTIGGDVSWVDVDSDGDLDLVGTKCGPSYSEARIFLNEQATLNSPNWDLPDGDFTDIEAGDIDGDGDLDLLLVGRSAILLENQTASPGKPPGPPEAPEARVEAGVVHLSWAAPVPMSLAGTTGSYNLRVGSTPGTADIMPPMTFPDGTRLLAAPGNAGLKTWHELGGLPPGTYYWSVQAVSPDLLGGPFTTVKSFEIPVEVGLVERDPGLLPLVTRAGAAAWADIDDDDDLDLFTSGQSGDLDYTMVYRNDGWGFTPLTDGLLGLQDARGIWIDYPTHPHPAFLLTGSTSSGTPVTKIFSGSYRGYGDGYHRLPHLADAALAWADVDQDGRCELFVSGRDADGPLASYFRWDESTYRWTEIPTSVKPVLGGAADFADFDDDGDLDLLLAGADPGTRVYVNAGGEFSDSGIKLVALTSPSARWGDDDGDGDLDILLAGQAEAGSLVIVYRNDGGVFSPVAVDIGDLQVSEAEWGDLDLDGDLDVVVGSASEERPALIFRNEKGSYRTGDWALAPVADADIQWGDQDGDGDLDLLLTGSTAGGPLVRLYLNELEVSRPLLPAPQGLAWSSDSTGDGWVTVTFRWDAVPHPGTWRPSYALRIGTGPGQDDVMTPRSNPETGFHSVPGPGNAGQGTSWTVRLPYGRLYRWSVQAIDSAWRGGPFASEQLLPTGDLPTSSPEIAWQTRLLAPRPNPFNPRTTLAFDLASPSTVSLKIYDVAGRLVRTVLSEHRAAGHHEVVWEGRDESGHGVASGVYLCQMRAGGVEETRRLVLVR